MTVIRISPIPCLFSPKFSVFKHPFSEYRIICIQRSVFFSCECRRSQSLQTIEVSLVLTGRINRKNASITSTQISIISVHNSAILVLAVCTDRVLAVYTSCIGYKHWEGMAKYHVLYIPLCYKCIYCKCLIISCRASHPEHFLATNLAFRQS